MDYLVDYLKNKGVKFIDNKVSKLNAKNNKIESVSLENGIELKKQIFSNYLLVLHLVKFWIIQI